MNADVDDFSEAPSSVLDQLIEAAADVFACRFVVTTRPATYKGEVVLQGPSPHFRQEERIMAEILIPANCECETQMRRTCALPCGTEPL